MVTDLTSPHPQTASRHARIRVQNGFTLLEIVVTLILIGLGAALVAPVFRREAPDDSLSAVLSSARELAVRRAQTLVFRVEGDGAWRLTTVDDTAAIATGLVTTPGSPRELTITPLGACFNQSRTSPETWDAIACAPAGDRSQ